MMGLLFDNISIRLEASETLGYKPLVILEEKWYLVILLGGYVTPRKRNQSLDVAMPLSPVICNTRNKAPRSNKIKNLIRRFNYN